jgi:hypothetical protein
MDPIDSPMAHANSPTADVYAGDMAAPSAAHMSAAAIHVFVIQADADPDVFARVAGIFNIANAAPNSVELSRDFEQVRMSVAIELDGAAVPEMICRKLAQLTCVISVELRSPMNR